MTPLGERPRGVVESAWTMSAFALMGYSLIDWSADPYSVSVDFVLYTLIAVPVLVTVRFYASGRNWARRLVLAVACLALLNLTLLPSASPYHRLFIGVEALFGAFLLYWLNTKKVRDWFWP